MIKRFFLMVLSGAIGAVILTVGSAALHIHEPTGVIAPGLGWLLGVAVGDRLARATYLATEEAVHGHPIQTFFLWLVMFVILAAGLIMERMKLSR